MQPTRSADLANPLSCLFIWISSFYVISILDALCVPQMHLSHHHIWIAWLQHPNSPKNGDGGKSADKRGEVKSWKTIVTREEEVKGHLASLACSSHLSILSWFRSLFLSVIHMLLLHRLMRLHVATIWRKWVAVISFEKNQFKNVKSSLCLQEG